MNRREFMYAAAAAAAITGVPSTASAAQSLVVNRNVLQGLVDDTAQSLGVVGGQLAIFDGSQVHEFSTGFANRERELKVTADTLFQIGSTTKLFNAALIMSLVDDGTLDLDVPVKRWIKDFKLPSKSATEVVTLRQLLSMSAGIDNGPYTDYGRGDDALDQYVAAMAEVPMIFAPGTAYGYSNACTNISGLAAVRATGKNWETLLAEKILEPLSLRHAANFPEDLLFHPVALGYANDPEPKQPRRIPFWGLPRSMAPAGATLCCSAGDLVRFASMFLNDGKALDSTQVLSEQSIKQSMTPVVDLPNKVMAHKWCPGPYWKVWDGYGIYGHSGTNTGGSSMLLWCPERNFAIATISNVAAQGYPFADRIFNTVFPEMLGIEKPKTLTPDQVAPIEVDLRRYEGDFVSWNNRMSFRIEDNRLIARAYSGNGSNKGEPAMSSAMLPLGDDRFLPAELAMSGNRNWDVAFWGTDNAGRATHYLNGVFAMRRST